MVRLFMNRATHFLGSINLKKALIILFLSMIAGLLVMLLLSNSSGLITNLYSLSTGRRANITFRVKPTELVNFENQTLLIKRVAILNSGDFNLGKIIVFCKVDLDLAYQSVHSFDINISPNLRDYSIITSQESPNMYKAQLEFLPVGGEFEITTRLKYPVPHTSRISIEVVGEYGLNLTVGNSIIIRIDNEIN